MTNILDTFQKIFYDSNEYKETFKEQLIPHTEGRGVFFCHGDREVCKYEH